MKLYDYFEHDGKIAIVMEFVERGELLSYIGPEGAPENEVRDVFLQILEALNYCHRHQVFCFSCFFTIVVLVGCEKVFFVKLSEKIEKKKKKKKGE